LFPLNQTLYTNDVDVPVIVTGASANHFGELQRLFIGINTIWRKAYPNTTVIMYDLGLADGQQQQVILTFCDS